MHEALHAWLASWLAVRREIDGWILERVNTTEGPAISVTAPGTSLSTPVVINEHKLLEGFGKKAQKEGRPLTAADEALVKLGSQNGQGLQGWVKLTRMVLSDVPLQAISGRRIVTTPEELADYFQGKFLVFWEAHGDDIALVGALPQDLFQERRARGVHPRREDIALVTALWDAAGVDDLFIAMRQHYDFQLFLSAVLEISREELLRLMTPEDFLHRDQFWELIRQAPWPNLQRKPGIRWLIEKYIEPRVSGTDRLSLEQLVQSWVDVVREGVVPEAWKETKRFKREWEGNRAVDQAFGGLQPWERNYRNLGLEGDQLETPVYTHGGESYDFHFSRFEGLTDEDRLRIAHTVSMFVTDWSYSDHSDHISKDRRGRNMVFFVHSPFDDHPQHRHVTQALVKAIADHSPYATIAFYPGVRPLSRSLLPANFVYAFGEASMARQDRWINAYESQVWRRNYPETARRVAKQAAPQGAKFGLPFSLWEIAPCLATARQTSPAQSSSIASGIAEACSAPAHRRRVSAASQPPIRMEQASESRGHQFASRILPG